jgi:hypothetical protein
MTEFFVCPDCEQPIATAPDSLCATCQKWRDQKLAAMDEEWQVEHERLLRRRMTCGQQFGEALADMAKVLERSKR